MKYNLFVVLTLIALLQALHGVADNTVPVCELDDDEVTCPSQHQHHQQQQRNHWNWIPEDEHRCNIARLTHDEVIQTFGSRGLPPLHPEPLVIRADPTSNRNANLVQLTSQANILSSLPPEFQVTLSSSNSYSAHRRTIPLAQYLDETLSAGETTPDVLSNETWYLFGETYTEEWRQLLKAYELPPCQTCTEEWVALAFGIGNRGSGVQWHVHGPGFSEALHGRKHWLLYPHKPTYHPDQTSRHWMEYTYPSLPTSRLPYECTLEPGDMIYFPDKWYHATINLDPYTAFISTFTTEHF